jgi:iron complex outermembrane recepter protein
VPSYTPVDANLRYGYRLWLLPVTASNLLDRTYVTSCYTADLCTCGDRARVLGTVRYRGQGGSCIGRDGRV